MQQCSMTDMHYFACQSTFRLYSSYFYLYCNNWFPFNFEASKYDYYTFPNGKSHSGRHEKCKLRSTEKCERSHAKVKKSVIQCKRSLSQNVVPCSIGNFARNQPAAGSSSISEKYQGAENAFSAAWLI